MTTARIAVVDYGIGNLRSAEKALTHLGADARLTADAEEIARAQKVAAEAQRIEAKFSRYRRGNIIDAINTAAARPVVVADETIRLLAYAARLRELLFAAIPSIGPQPADECATALAGARVGDR